MALLTTPGWLENAGAVHSAAEMRSYIGSLIAGTNTASTDLIPRGGIHPGLGAEFMVTQTGTPSMAVEVGSGSAWVPGTQDSTQGVYGVLNNATVTLSIDAAHVSLDRIDLVVIRIRDSDYSGGDDDATLLVVTGTPDSSPVVPTAPDNSLPLATVAVGSGVSSIVNANITSQRRFFATVGGVIPHGLEANIYTSNNVFEGQLQYARDTDRLFMFDGSSNFQVWDKAIEGAGRIPRGIMANPTSTSSDGTSTTGTTEVRDAVLGNYVFTSAGTSRRYRVTLSGATVISTTTNRIAVRIRDGGASTPTTSSTLLAEGVAKNTTAGASGRQGITCSATFTAAAGTRTLSTFYVGIDSGTVTAGGTRQLYVEDIGPVI